MVFNSFTVLIRLRPFQIYNIIVTKFELLPPKKRPPSVLMKRSSKFSVQ